MRTDIAIEKLCNIAPYIAELAEGLAKDNEYINYMQSDKAKTKNAIFALRVLPIVLKEPHKEKVFSILAIWNDKTIEEIKEQSLGCTINEIKAIFTDEDFKSFFSLSNAKDEMSGA